MKISDATGRSGLVFVSHGPGRSWLSVYRHLIAGLLLAGMQVGCGGLPKLPDRVTSDAFFSPLETSLGQQLAQASRRHPNQSGILLLDQGRDAFRYRAALIDAAERAIDLQYFIWNDDRTGNYLAARLLAAAERGVRVRLLLDDFHAVGNDSVIPALNAHPNVEVRVFNPFGQRKGLERWLELLLDLARLNRRMHNKALVVDGAAAIVGGRNIGDEYFDLRDDRAFLDRDLLVAGRVVTDMEQAYDSYWNSDWSYPLESLMEKSPSASASEALHAELRAREQPDIPVPVNPSQSLAMIQSAAGDFIWAPVELVVDRVPETDTGSGRPKEVALHLAELIRQADSDILIESAYLVLGEPGLSMIGDAVQRGVRVRALTNSLASNDLVPNHAAYVRRRTQMLRAGMELNELMPYPEDCAKLAPEARACEMGGKLGLHTKSVVFDADTTFIGSFNVNARSVFLNTEMGLLIHSRELASRLHAAVEPKLESGSSWRVTLEDSGQGVMWSGRSGGRERRYSGEPEVSFWQSFSASFLSLFSATQYF